MTIKTVSLTDNELKVLLAMREIERESHAVYPTDWVADHSGLSSEEALEALERLRAKEIVWGEDNWHTLEEEEE